MPVNDALQRRVYLEDALQDSGIPYTGITVVDVNANPPAVTIQYDPIATQQQREAGDAILAAFDWRRRQPLPLATVRTTLNGLLVTNADRFDFLITMLAQLLRNDGRTAAKIARLLNKTGVAVDEVVP